MTGRNKDNNPYYRPTALQKATPFLVVFLAIIIMALITFALVSQPTIAKAGVKDGNTMIRLQDDRATKLKPLHPNCQEDEGWVPVPQGTPNSFEDLNGVTRACIHLDDLATSN